MDSSVVLFAVTLVIGFIFLRWLISPIPESNDLNLDTSALSKEEKDEESSSSNGTASTKKRRDKRPVTDSMIEVVQTIAPRLTVEQIRFDLEKTGSVEVTIDKYMENGDLPHPPN
ncbi:CUE1 [Candida margitis]|uniref:CUE1 n=1 Tax=Candida margitis TaxID=1775924 RepID=UPI002227F337|nr:CUE1 [Candida margitis]KAI5970271.1 CUE1 [Candida margitis]